MKFTKFIYLSLALLFYSACTVIAVTPDISTTTTTSDISLAPGSGIFQKSSDSEILQSSIIYINTDNLGTPITIHLNENICIFLLGKIEDNIEYQWEPDLSWKEGSIYTKDGILEMIGCNTRRVLFDTPDLNISKIRFERFYFFPRLVGSTQLSFKLNKTLKDTTLNPYGQIEVLGSIEFTINVVPIEDVNTQPSQ